MFPPHIKKASDAPAFTQQDRHELIDFCWKQGNRNNCDTKYEPNSYFLISFIVNNFLIFSTASTETRVLFINVRRGHEAILSCENVINDQNNCDATTWNFVNPSCTETVELIRLGQIGENTKSKSDRLSVTEKCSLVIKNVTDEDAGHYFCQQYKSGQKQGSDSVVHLSVISSEYLHHYVFSSNCQTLQ